MIFRIKLINILYIHNQLSDCTKNPDCSWKWVAPVSDPFIPSYAIFVEYLLVAAVGTIVNVFKCDWCWAEILAYYLIYNGQMRYLLRYSNGNNNGNYE